MCTLTSRLHTSDHPELSGSPGHLSSDIKKVVGTSIAAGFHSRNARYLNSFVTWRLNQNESFDGRSMTSRSKELSNANRRWRTSTAIIHFTGSSSKEGCSPRKV